MSSELRDYILPFNDQEQTGKINLWFYNCIAILRSGALPCCLHIREHTLLAYNAKWERIRAIPGQGEEREDAFHLLEESAQCCCSCRKRSGKWSAGKHGSRTSWNHPPKPYHQCQSWDSHPEGPEGRSRVRREKRTELRDHNSRQSCRARS